MLFKHINILSPQNCLDREIQNITDLLYSATNRIKCNCTNHIVVLWKFHQCGIIVQIIIQSQCSDHMLHLKLSNNIPVVHSLILSWMWFSELLTTKSSCMKLMSGIDPVANNAKFDTVVRFPSHCTAMGNLAALLMVSLWHAVSYFHSGTESNPRLCFHQLAISFVLLYNLTSVLLVSNI